MPLGSDQQYDVSWKEQDKMRRRQEIRTRLKAEGIDKKYSPFNHMKGNLFSDPAMSRYEDYRKKGRLPGAPFAARIFYTYCAMIFIPIAGLKLLLDYETTPYNDGCASGDIPYQDRWGKS